MTLFLQTRSISEKENGMKGLLNEHERGMHEVGGRLIIYSQLDFIIMIHIIILMPLIILAYHIIFIYNYLFFVKLSMQSYAAEISLMVSQLIIQTQPILLLAGVYHVQYMFLALSLIMGQVMVISKKPIDLPIHMLPQHAHVQLDYDWGL
ncbi:hypothetical protein ACJX0J_035061, partial [Zea mays]